LVIGCWSLVVGHWLLVIGRLGFVCPEYSTIQMTKDKGQMTTN
jgi:hypothetical protein